MALGAALWLLSSSPGGASAPPDTSAAQALAPAGDEAGAAVDEAARHFAFFGDRSAAPVIGAVTISGARPSNQAIIRRELGLGPGDPFDERWLERAWDDLEDLGYFAYVDIVTEENDDGAVDIAISVEEEKTLRGHPLIQYDRRHKYLLGGRLREGNFRGRGETLELTAMWHRVHGYRLTWQRPWLLNRRALWAEATAGWERADFVFRPTGYQRWEAGGRLQWRLRPPLYLEGEAGYVGFKQRDTFSETAPDRGSGSPGLLTWSSGWRERWVVGATLGWDSRDIEYYPLRGGYYRATVRGVLGAAFDSYGEAVLDLRRFLPTPWRHVLGLRAWGRRVDGPVPPEDRLYWGGPATIRGVSYASLEGEEGYLLTAEYRWPLFLMPISPDGRVIGIGTHFFFDAGDAWYDGAKPGRAHLSWGAGAHINLSTQHFRFEFARTRDGKNVFQFEDTFTF